MKYTVDNDLHIHTKLSPCSGDPLQNTDNILQYAADNGFKDICITDHYWDENVPGATTYLAKLDTELLKKNLPLPKKEGINFYFGCETELDRFGHLAISQENFDTFDFIVIPINHFHQVGFALAKEDNNNVPVLAKRWAERFDFVLRQNLPFEKIGMAHLTCELMATDRREAHIEVVDAIDEDEMKRLFSLSAEKGLGIELNFETFFDYTAEQLSRLMRPYVIAKAEGCKFYFGSDAHHPEEMVRSKEKFEKVVDILRLTEDDKFRISHR